MAMYTPEYDMFGTRPDGRQYLIARAGVPMPLEQARRLGIVKDNSQPVAPPQRKVSKTSDATPAAIRTAREHGIDLSEVEGTGADGRIIVSDVTALIGNG